MQVGKVFMSLQVKEFNGFRLSKHEDCHYLADRLRYEDKREILRKQAAKCKVKSKKIDFFIVNK